MQNIDQLPDAAHIGRATLETWLGCSASTISRRVRSGALPAPIQLVSNRNAWRVGDVRAWLAATACKNQYV